MAAPAQTTPDALDPSAPADPIALAAFVSRRGGRVVAYLDAVTTPDRALHAAGEAFAGYRQSRVADPDREADATLLLRAVRRAATTSAENPYRPEGRERPARRTRACEAMPRLLVAWTESRLPEGDVGRLIEHLQECPDCRALRDAFDRAEIGYRDGESSDLDGTEIGVIATAMALATTSAAPPFPERATRTAVPSDAPRPRRTAIPAPPTSVADHLAKPSGPAPVGRRTAIPAPPTALPPTPSPEPAAPESGARTTDAPAPSSGGPAGPDPVRPRRTDLPAAPATRDAPAPRSPRPTSSGGAPEDPEDPLGPEALGYAVPRSGLPRPVRRPAVPRVKRRRPRRPASAAVEATAAVERPSGAATTGPSGTGTSGTDGDATARVGAAPREVVLTADERSATAAETTAPSPASAPTTAGTAAPADSATPAATDEPAVAAPEDRAVTTSVAVVPATVGEASTTDDRGRLSTVGRRALQTPIVRQLGVPAVLLLAVLIAALIAAGAFAGDEGDSVDPVTRPSLQSVPSDPNEIPPLR